MPEPLRVAKTLRLAPDTWEALERMARKDRRSVSNLIQDILETHIDAQEGWSS